MSIAGLSDILGKMDVAFWNNFQRNYEFKNVEVTSFLIFLLLLIFSNLFTYMIRIFYSSRPVLHVNTVSIIKLYIVEILNFIVTMLSLPSLWVSSVSFLPFSMAYVLGLLTPYMGYIIGGLASAVGIIRMLIVLQVTNKYFSKRVVFNKIVQNLKFRNDVKWCSEIPVSAPPSTSDV